MRPGGSHQAKVCGEPGKPKTRFDAWLTQPFRVIEDCSVTSRPCFGRRVPYQGSAHRFSLLTCRKIDRQNKLPPEGSHVFFNGEPRMPDKLLIDLWGLTISAEGIYAIGAAVIIIIVWRLR